MKILLTEAQVQEGVRRMAAEISAFYGDRPLTIVGVLTGSVVLLADIIRLLGMPLRVSVVQARSYRGASTVRGELMINSDLLPDLTGCDVLVVDDIFDTGHTLFELLNKMQNLGPRSIRSAVLLRKRGRQEMTREPDYCAFEIPDEFVVGYGLDYNDHYRNLPYIGALEAAEIEAGKNS
ncbi:MAG: hypoxanthine phosphoribosyltransferase [Planctomycetes bacterium]|nr:hypoxanthine phosphoribosyltransferase [Planctomycetota bacterium]